MDELVKRIRRCSYLDPNGGEVCHDCPNREDFYECKQKLALQAADAIEELQKRVPKAPHGDLIDRDALRASIRESIEECHKWADEVDKDTMMYARISQSLGTFVECSLRAKAAPTIIPAEPPKAEEAE